MSLRQGGGATKNNRIVRAAEGKKNFGFLCKNSYVDTLWLIKVGKFLKHYLIYLA